MVLATALVAAPAAAAPDGETDAETVDETNDAVVVSGEVADTTPVTLPLIPVPIGCAAPPAPHIVFVGTVVERDVRTIRYRIDTIRYGRSDPFAGGDRIDVRYGLDAQYLHDGETYLVSALVDPDLGVLISRVTDPIENFGGDDVIGVSESDVNCPDLEDPMRTLHLDGTDIDAGLLSPFLDAKFRILGAFLLPSALAVGAIFLLASLRLSLWGLVGAIVRSTRR